MATSKRRWFAYSLRTLFVMVTLVAIFGGYQVNWIRQRREARARAIAEATKYPQKVWGLSWKTLRPIEGGNAPGLLWLFGETGISRFVVPVSAPKPTGFDDEDRARILRLQGLFPEAEIVYGHVDRDGILHLYWPDAGPIVFDPLIARPEAR